MTAACLCAPGIAGAEERASPPESSDAQASSEERAKALFEAGQEHYERGEYQAAVGAFREAQRLLPRPELLYNLAQAERLSGDCRSSLEHYRAFEAAGGDVPTDLPEKIAEMERCSAPAARDEVKAPVAPIPAATATRPDSKPSPPPDDQDATFRILGWSSLGGAALAAAFGTVFALRANSASNELDDVNRQGARWNAHYQSVEDSMVRDRNIAIGLFIGAGVLAGTGAWLLVSPPTGSNGNGIAINTGWKF